MSEDAFRQRNDTVAKGQAKARYARREILGLTDADRQIMLDAVLARLYP